VSRAGNRNPRYRPGYGRFSSTRRAWLKTIQTQQLILHGITDEDRIQKEEKEQDWIRASQDEEGTSYIIMIPVPGRTKGLTWDLTGMTPDELEAFKKFMDLAISLAEPVVRVRQKVAEDAEQAGDDTYSRIYREPPVFVDRERAQRKNGQGVHDRSEDAPSGDGEDSN
jgi:hypothetical protein